MPRDRLPLRSLHAWSSLNNATFSNVQVEPIANKGYGLVAQRDSNLIENGPSPLITIPPDLVLNAGTVEEYAKADRNFRILLDTCGHKSPRHDVLLFLLVQLILSSGSHQRVALPTSWTEYIKMLDDDVPVPTLWNEDERCLLRGTSLESALDAKLLALTHEFDDIRDISSKIEPWKNAFWGNDSIRLVDWVRLDAWYRSRVLELPRSGLSMVPCIDMANHSINANARYDESAQNEVNLLLDVESRVAKGQEITINYGSGKSAAEMLFSYGFLDPTSAARSLTLPLEPLPDDPLAKAKLHIFNGAPTVQVMEVDGSVEYSSPFAHFMCLNEEDGLDFRVLQTSDGHRELKMFWQEQDVTDQTTSFELLVAGHELRDVFRLRVNMIITQRLDEQLQQFGEVAEADLPGEIDSLNAAWAHDLRRIEKGILQVALTALEEQRNQLLQSGSVTDYLVSMQAGEGLVDNTSEEAAEYDFS